MEPWHGVWTCISALFGIWGIIWKKLHVQPALRTCILDQLIDTELTFRFNTHFLREALRTIKCSSGKRVTCKRLNGRAYVHFHPPSQPRRLPRTDQSRPGDAPSILDWKPDSTRLGGQSQPRGRPPPGHFRRSRDRGSPDPGARPGGCASRTGERCYLLPG